MSFFLLSCSGGSFASTHKLEAGDVLKPPTFHRNWRTKDIVQTRKRTSAGERQLLTPGLVIPTDLDV